MEEKSHKEETSLTFEETLSRLEAERRLDPAVTRAADYLYEASLLDENRDILEEVKNNLQRENPRELFLRFLKDCISDFKTADRSHQYRYVKQLSDVAIMGLGIWQEDLGLAYAGKETLRFSGDPNWTIIEERINSTVFGEYFIEELCVPVDEVLWGTKFPLRMSACDASQHRFKLQVPFNRTWATPVVVNNSGGTLKVRVNNDSKWQNISVPRDTTDYEDWVILGPDDYASMEEGNYEWAAKSSMDVGEFFVEETFIFKHEGVAGKPDVHFRDGRVFPQDHLMNCKLENRHGQLTREAIYRMVTTCRTAKELNIIFCGVAKQVKLKIYSTIVNWYITKIMGIEKWNPTGQVISDSDMMRNILFHKKFQASSFNKIYVTCPILRRFETTSNLNRRTRKQVKNDLDSLVRIHHNRDLTAKDIVDDALKIGVVMFFAGHSPTDELYIPRYEFVTNLDSETDGIKDEILKILSGLRLATFDVDEDHLWGLEEPISTLVPTPILIAHNISKKMGEELASNFAQRTIGEFIKRLRAEKKYI